MNINSDWLYAKCLLPQQLVCKGSYLFLLTEYPFHRLGLSSPCSPGPLGSLVPAFFSVFGPGRALPCTHWPGFARARICSSPLRLRKKRTQIRLGTLSTPCAQTALFNLISMRTSSHWLTNLDIDAQLFTMIHTY